MTPNMTPEPAAAALSVCGVRGRFAAPWLCRSSVSGGCGSAAGSDKMRISRVMLVVLLTGAIMGCNKSSDQTHNPKPASPFSQTAFSLADCVNRNDTNPLRQLLNSGVNPDIVSLDGSTALGTAAGMGETQIVQLLLQHGANPNITGPKGNALHMATRYGLDHPEVTALLIESGVKLDSVDAEGHTPMDNAVQNHLAKSEKLIRTALGEKISEPGGAAHLSQPSGSEPNRASSAARSGP